MTGASIRTIRKFSVRMHETCFKSHMPLEAPHPAFGHPLPSRMRGEGRVRTPRFSIAHCAHEPAMEGRGLRVQMRCTRWLHRIRPPRTSALQEVRFMERENLQNLDASWGHEPEMRKPFRIKPGTFRFMERLASPNQFF